MDWKTVVTAVGLSLAAGLLVAILTGKATGAEIRQNVREFV